MPKYRVNVTEEVVYLVDVEAANKGLAELVAEQIFLEAEDTNEHFHSLEYRSIHVEKEIT